MVSFKDPLAQRTRGSAEDGIEGRCPEDQGGNCGRRDDCVRPTRPRQWGWMLSNTTEVVVVVVVLIRSRGHIEERTTSVV